MGVKGELVAGLWLRALVRHQNNPAEADTEVNRRSHLMTLERNCFDESRLQIRFINLTDRFVISPEQPIHGRQMSLSNDRRIVAVGRKQA